MASRPLTLLLTKGYPMRIESWWRWFQHQLLTQPAGPTAKKSRRDRTVRGRRLFFEPLEERRVLALANGSFEDPDVPDGGYSDFCATSPCVGMVQGIPGWTVVGTDVAVVDSGAADKGITFKAQDGNQWIDLAGISSNDLGTGMTQSVPT